MTNRGITGLSVIDDLDTRREIFFLLAKLDQTQRTAFMREVVDLLNAEIRRLQPPPWNLVRYWSVDDSVNETYMDLLLLLAQFNVPVEATLIHLEAFVLRTET